MARRVAKWIGIAFAGLVALVLLVLLGLDTSPGRRFIVDRVAGFETASGVTIHAGRIDGSIYGRMTIRDLQVRDPRGTFLQSPALTVDWRPFAYLRKHIDVRELSAASVTLLRNPALKPTPSDPNAPILPDIDLSVARLAIDRLVLEKPVTGRRHILRLAGSADIADGRARVAADAAALRGAGVAGGDRLHVRLDAKPDADRFALDARLAAPAGGLVDSYAHLGRPLALAIGGAGDWARWQGRARGLLGAERLADLAITGDHGSFHTLGELRPGLILAGPVARLTAPALRLDLTTKLAKRTVDLRLVAASDALAVTAAGLVDLGQSSVANLHLDAQLLTPGAIAPNVRGRDVRLVADVDGKMATPTIAYRLSAASLGFGTTGIAGLQANGRARIDTDRIAVPVHATARAVTGLDASVGGLLTRLRVDGDIAYQNGKVATDNLHLASERIDATAILLADLAKGTYTGALKGRINDYQVNGLGRVDLVTDAHLVPGRDSGFAIRGHVRAVTRRITNAGVAGQLGGNALVDADVGYDLAGGATASNLRLRSPKFRITSGGGSYRPDGRLAFRAAGRSADYGPFTLAASGTIARPVATLTAASPGLGVGAKGIVATLSGSAAGYRVQARGASDYGPFAADVTLRTGRGPTAFDIASASFAGIRFAGSVMQTAAGPFAGTLTLAGSGLNGSVRLAAAGKAQRADVNVRAAAARLPGPSPIVIGTGTIRATALLVPGAPQVDGQMALGDVHLGTLAIARAQARLAYNGGQGRLALIAAGSNVVPFSITAQASLAPTRVVANLRGQVNGIAVSLAAPAVASKVGAEWQLAPATLVLPQGRVELSGRYGRETALHADLRGLDLSLADAFAPSLGLGGTASGTLDYVARGTVPDVRARVDLAGFTRTAAFSVSPPVDIALLATLNDGGADLRALLRRGGATFGQLRVRAAPLAGGAALTDRLLDAPLSGGIRYSGPAETLWAFAGLADQQLSGPVAIGADLGGRLRSPTVNGLVRANALRYENGTYGTVLSQIAVDGRFTQSRLQLDSLTARAGKGSLSASGNVGLDAAAGFPIDLHATLQEAQLARSDALAATVSGTVAVTNSRVAGGLIRGDLRIPEARYEIVRQGAADVVELTGVRRKGATPPPTSEAAALPSNWKLDIHIRAPNQIFVSGMGLEAEWRTDMRVSGTATQPSVTGRLEVVRGTFSFAGRRFNLDRGVVTFQGPLTDPLLDIQASTTTTDVTAAIIIGGYAQRPQLSFTSTPALPQDEVLSRILFGASVTSLSPTQAIQLAAALNSLRGSGGGGLNPLGKLRSVAGIDRLRVLGADQSAGHGTALAAGKYISNNIYVEVITDARGFTATQLEISLSRALSVLSSAGSFGGSNVSVRYKKDY